jgi:exopolyphosphatase/guanosine-5'-triphosphate,3'-diphosphate pyrophosphatase
MELEPLHKLTRSERKLLEYAAILHDIGYFLTSRRHHKHALQMIMTEPLLEFTRSEKLIIANTARYHRRAWPTVDHMSYGILSDQERHRVDLLSPLLRLADGLDSSHSSVVQELTCQIYDDSVILYIEAQADHDTTAEIQSALTRSELFRSVYKRGVKIERTGHPSQSSENLIEAGA